MSTDMATEDASPFGGDVTVRKGWKMMHLQVSEEGLTVLEIIKRFGFTNLAGYKMFVNDKLATPETIVKPTDEVKITTSTPENRRSGSIFTALLFGGVITGLALGFYFKSVSLGIVAGLVFWIGGMALYVHSEIA